jgi:NAD-dependent DNA ligase
MADNEMLNVFGGARIDDRTIAEVIGIAHGMLADGAINQAEVQYLQRWLDARSHVTSNPVVRVLRDRIALIMADGIMDADEARDLMSTLTAFVGGELEEGELTKSSSLPLCAPAPTMSFYGAPICFTGTFAFGTRKDCEAAVIPLGAVPGSLTAETQYLVVGAYATESWAQSAFGRKIEKAAEMRAGGRPIRIVGEAHWVEQMKR